MADTVFVWLLAASLLQGAFARVLPLSLLPLFFASCGVASLVLSCGEESVHPLSTGLSTAFILVVTPQRFHGKLCALVCFGYLAVVRVAAQLHGPANAAQLMLTLRLTSLGFDSSDGRLAAATPQQLLLYMCSAHGLFTGPFYTFHEWHSAMHPTAPPAPPRAVAAALARGALAVVIWQTVVHALPFHRTRTEAWLELPLAFRLGYFFVSSAQFRFRFYSCWLIVEAAGLLVGFPTPSNVHVLACELAARPSSYIAAWNTSVQQFLVAYVYRRIPFKSRPIRQCGVFLVSAFWHGVRPGYYICFGFIFCMVCVEHLVSGATRETALVISERRVLRALVGMVGYVWTMGCFCFAGVAFNMLEWSDTRAVWHSVDNYGIYLLLAPVLPCICVMGARRRTPSPAVKHRAD